MTDRSKAIEDLDEVKRGTLREHMILWGMNSMNYAWSARTLLTQTKAVSVKTPSQVATSVHWYLNAKRFNLRGW